MTTEATTTADPSAGTPATSEPIGSTDLVHVDPAGLLVDRNIRAARLDRLFLASVKQHGVLAPIVAVRDGEQLRVRYGHRRALAAVEAGLPVVPVYVAGAEDAAEDAGTPTRPPGSSASGPRTSTAPP